MMRLGILGSTRGTHLLALLEAIKNQSLSATISIVLSNKPDALILEKAKTADIPHAYIPVAGLNRTQYDIELTEYLSKAQVDLVVLIGYMRILSPEFVTHWKDRIINVHPSLLPAFAGKMDLAVHQAVIDAKVPETGCTVHFVTAEVDAGPIILQKKCPVLASDTAEGLKLKVQQLEALALVDAINSLTV